MDRFDLGAHRREISTSSAKAQRWFDLGLNWCYGFNQEEGVKCFEEALEHDPDCVMAHWGAAANGATAVENMLVEALAARFQKPHAVSGEEFDQWDDDYADAMRRVYHSNRDDHDVAALFAEALMTRTPWKLWDVKRGVPAPNADTLEALDVLERSNALNDAAEKPQHPAILHLHIRATEMSNEPEQSMRSTDILGTLCPDAGHMNHMPGHTYVLCGEYEKAKSASEKAIRADEIYLDYAGPFNFYTTARCHDLHVMMYTCMFVGQFEPAMDAARRLREILPKEVLGVEGRPQLAVTLEGYYSMQMHVLVRFGRWRQIVDTPLARRSRALLRADGHAPLCQGHCPRSHAGVRPSRSRARPFPRHGCAHSARTHLLQQLSPRDSGDRREDARWRSRLSQGEP